MVVALKEVKIRGEIRTIVDYVVDMVQSPDFIGNRIHTGWLDSRIASQVRSRALPSAGHRPRWDRASPRRPVGQQGKLHGVLHMNAHALRPDQGSRVEP